MKSLLLSCSRLQGKHTGDNVVVEFEDIVCAYVIYTKIVAVVTDNTSNMKKGFSNLQEHFPGFEDVLDAEESGNESEDDMEIEEELDKEENYVDERLHNNELTIKHISCFAHTLQLCVSDGIKGCRRLQNLLVKAGKIVAHVRKSTIVIEKLEEEFRKVLIAKNDTRWNSQLPSLMRLLEVDDINGK